MADGCTLIAPEQARWKVSRLKSRPESGRIIEESRPAWLDLEYKRPLPWNKDSSFPFPSLFSHSLSLTYRNTVHSIKYQKRRKWWNSQRREKNKSGSQTPNLHLNEWISRVKVYNTHTKEMTMQATGTHFTNKHYRYNAENYYQYTVQVDRIHKHCMCNKAMNTT